jgi:phosphopentomutase
MSLITAPWCSSQRQSIFTDAAATIGDAFSVTPPQVGRSFLKDISTD